MGRSCIIHIGMHKTGTSSIQVSLYNFSDDKYFYADLGMPNHSIPICMLFKTDPKRFKDLKDRSLQEINNIKKEAYERLVNSIKRSKSKTLIISGEGIRGLSKDELINFRSFLEERGFDDIKVFAYVRSPAGYMSSAFQEILKHEPLHFSQIRKCYPFYRAGFEKFYEVFGEGNVILRKFDPNRFPKGCVVRDFCNIFGIKLPEDRIKRINESFPEEVVKLIYILRNYKKNVKIKRNEIQRLGNYLSGRMKDLGLKKFKIDGSLIKPIIEENIEDIRWMEKRLGESLLEEDIESMRGIRSEEDLLKVDRRVIDRLIEISGYSGEGDIKVSDIAEMVWDVLDKRVIKKVGKEIKGEEIRGRVVVKDSGKVVGWVMGKEPKEKVKVRVYINDELKGEQIANKMRPKLKKRGIHPTGRCGFIFNLDRFLKKGDRIRVEYIYKDKVVDKEVIEI